MKIAAQYSHLNGLEFLLVRHPDRWKEIQKVIGLVDPERCRTKASKEKGKAGKGLLYSPTAMNDEMRNGFKNRGWAQQIPAYWGNRDEKLTRATMPLAPEQQKAEIAAAANTPIYSLDQTDFVKDRIAVEVQFGKYFAVAYDLFVKHLAFYIGDVIDVGVEIVPMKNFQDQFASGSAYYEGELYNVIREGRGVPAVPLVLMGIVP